MKDRREAWFKENGPCRHCGSWNDLELDHIDPSEKEHHAIWSWSDERREAELKKCQPLCYGCHKKKTFQDLYASYPNHSYRKGCRCVDCKAAHAKERREYRAAGKDPSRNNYKGLSRVGLIGKPPVLETGHHPGSTPGLATMILTVAQGQERPVVSR